MTNSLSFEVFYQKSKSIVLLPSLNKFEKRSKQRQVLPKWRWDSCCLLFHPDKSSPILELCKIDKSDEIYIYIY
ncbi:hypothetical protein ACOSQ3_012443 [Xanthoceras sorbifolium]